MLVSIIIPVYNAAPYIQRCLDSCLVQTHRELEVICVDDGSTDGCGAILDEHVKAHKNIKVFHQVNSGVVVARRKAIGAAKGEFCYFLDADDWLPKTAIADLVAVVDNETDIVFGDQVVVYSDGREVRRTLLPGTEWGGIEYMNDSLRHINGCIGGKMFRTTFCRKLEIDGSMRLNEDLLMNIQAGAMARKAKRIAGVNYYYNWAAEGSLSKSQSEESVNSVIAANRAIAELLRSQKEYFGALGDGYVAYLQKNIVKVLTSGSNQHIDFLVKEARKAFFGAFDRFFAYSRSFGLLCPALFLFVLGTFPARLWWRFAIVVANLKRTCSKSKG